MDKILVIEDETDLLEELVDLLRFENYQVRGASSGDAGLEMIQQEAPDLVLCDIMMPGQDGYEVLSRFRQEPRTAAVPFIFLTAKVTKDDLRLGMNLGADDYLTKPIDAEQLLRAIRARLKRYRLIQYQTQEQLLASRRAIIHRLPHELYTPLNSILGFSKMLSSKAGQMSLMKIIETSRAIYRNSLRLYHLIQNHLLYIELDVLEHEPERLRQMRATALPSPDKLIADIGRKEAQRHNRELDLSLQLDGVAVCMLEKHFQVIVTELIDNAFKFSKPGTPVVFSATAHKEHLFLKLINLGQGMSDEQIRHIDVYTQFDRDTQEQQGMGMGLILVQRLLRIYEQSLEIDSLPDKYTQVSFQVPLALEDASVGGGHVGEDHELV